jgi:hypothetical protein
MIFRDEDSNYATAFAAVHCQVLDNMLKKNAAPFRERLLPQLMNHYSGTLGPF